MAFYLYVSIGNAKYFYNSYRNVFVFGMKKATSFMDVAEVQAQKEYIENHFGIKSNVEVGIKKRGDEK